jgi:hypothetical protein
MTRDILIKKERDVFLLSQELHLADDVRKQFMDSQCVGGLYRADRLGGREYSIVHALTCEKLLAGIICNLEVEPLMVSETSIKPFEQALGARCPLDLEQYVCQFKPLEMTPRLADFHAYFLLWLTLLLDESLHGWASNQTRIYDLGAVARNGLEADDVRQRAEEILSHAPPVLEHFGFSAEPLDEFRNRLQTRRLPADDLIDLFRAETSIAAVLRSLCPLYEPDASPSLAVHCE